MMTTLRRLAFLALLSVFMAVPACTTTGTPPPVNPTPVQTFEHCSSDALRQSSEGILGGVMTALASGNYEAELIKLGATYTAAEVGCAVDLAIDLLKTKATRTDDTQVAVQLAHAQQFRVDHP